MAMSYQRSEHSLRHGRSSSQASLARILRTISTFRPCGAFEERDDSDLNLSLGDSVMEDEDSFVCQGSTAVCVNLQSETASAPPRVVAALETSFHGECESKSEQELDFTEITEPIEVLIESEERVAEEVSRITNLQVESEKEEREEDGKVRDGSDKEKTETESFWRNEDGYIGMLIEAAEVISRKSEEEERGRKRGSSNDGSEVNRGFAGVHDGGESEKRVGPRPARAGLRKRAPGQCWMMVGMYNKEKEEEEEEEDNDDDVSPVVKSKRGRSQVLPYRFRDSVLEPWKPLSRGRANPVPSRKRSRR